MSNKILFCTGEGIGNVVQCIPAIRTIKEVLGYEIDFWHAFGSFAVPKLIPYVDDWYAAGGIVHANKEYAGKVSTFWTKRHVNFAKLSSVPLLNKIQPLSVYHSEVDTYMDIARDLGVAEKDLIWHGNCDYIESKFKYDVVIHDGFNPHGSANWKIKSYPHYSMVADALVKRGYSVCSVGQSHEHVRGTEDRTNLTLLSTLGVIKNCKVFLGNDSGLYHCANALEVKNVVIFTATSIEKNYDSRFHKFSTIIGRDDLKCRPCQDGRRWKNCGTWECRQMDPELVFSTVLKELA